MSAAVPAWAYLVRCPDGSLYAGWTNDLARRLQAHRTGKGAKYTRMRGHGAGRTTLAYAEPCADKSTALKREAALKRLTKPEKEALAAAWAAANRVTLRMATPQDGAAVAALYNTYVRGSTATFQYAEATAQGHSQLIEHTLRRCPFLLAESADGRLLGYASAHPWAEKEGFQWDVETTVYCAPQAVGQGVGRQLYTALLAILRAQGYRNAYARITHPNPDSEAFHKRFGFVRYGLEPHTAYKLGQWLDLGYWRAELAPADAEPAPVRPALPPQELAALLASAAAAQPDP